MTNNTNAAVCVFFCCYNKKNNNFNNNNNRLIMTRTNASSFQFYHLLPLEREGIQITIKTFFVSSPLCFLCCFCQLWRLRNKIFLNISSIFIFNFFSIVEKKLERLFLTKKYRASVKKVYWQRFSYQIYDVPRDLEHFRFHMLTLFRIGALYGPLLSHFCS